MTELPPETLAISHRFLDEMGNPTFFGKGKECVIGHQGVSLGFGMGIAKIERPLAEVREEIRTLQQQVTDDPLLNTLPSVVKRVNRGGFFFHACKDTPDVRTVFLHYLRELPCSIEVVVARKIPSLFARKHHGQEDEFYADLLAHLIKNRLKKAHQLVLNVAARGSSTRSKVLNESLMKAIGRAGRKWGEDRLQAKVVFNVQTPLTEPLLCVPDYLNWAVQRVFERGETRYYDYLKDKIRLVVDLYDQAIYAGSGNYYDPKRHPLTAQNKLSPPTT
jgi:hypothetical protein